MNKFFLIAVVSLVVACLLPLNLTSCEDKEVLKSEQHYKEDIKNLGTTLRECTEARKSEEELSTIRVENCKTADRVNADIVTESLYR